MCCVAKDGTIFSHYLEQMFERKQKIHLIVLVLSSGRPSWLHLQLSPVERPVLTDRQIQTSKEDTDFFLRVCIKTRISVLNCTLLRRNTISINEPLRLTITQPAMCNCIGCVTSFEWTLLSNTVSPPSEAVVIMPSEAVVIMPSVSECPTIDYITHNQGRR